MERIFLVFAAAVALAACGRSVEADPTPPKTLKEGGVVDLGGGLMKRCDYGRAIYTYFQNGVSVVADAEECQT